jgi:hypothetical protein
VLALAPALAAAQTYTYPSPQACPPPSGYSGYSQGTTTTYQAPAQYPPPAYAPAPIEQTAETAFTNYGIAIQLGGGVMGFVQEPAKNLADTGVAWDVRAVFGTRSVLALELAYSGAYQSLSAPGLDANLVKNGGEAALRINLGTGSTYGGAMVNPFLFGGVGWNRYDVVNENLNLGVINKSDTSGVIPFGVGLSIGGEGFMLDTRFTYRRSFNENLIPTGTRLPNGSTTSTAQLDTWEATASLGFEF